MRGREWTQLIRSAMLVAVLLLAQSAVATHLDLDDSHPAGDSCALCTGASVQGAANVAAVAVLDAIAPTTPVPAEAQVLRFASRQGEFHARGPPRAS